MPPSPSGSSRHQGKHFSFSNLRLLPRTLQRPSPPRWTAVVSAESARRAARRGLKISTGFNSTKTIKTIFDAYRREADAAGIAAGPDCLALRRRVAVAPTAGEAQDLRRRRVRAPEELRGAGRPG